MKIDWTKHRKCPPLVAIAIVAGFIVVVGPTVVQLVRMFKNL